jgi:hypothetical protein
MNYCNYINSTIETRARRPELAGAVGLDYVSVTGTNRPTLLPAGREVAGKAEGERF